MRIGTLRVGIAALLVAGSMQAQRPEGSPVQFTNITDNTPYLGKSCQNYNVALFNAVTGEILRCANTQGFNVTLSGIWSAAGGIWSLAPPANSVVIFGDSITQMNTYVSGTGNVVQYSDEGYFTWANAYLGQRFKLLNNAGIEGNTTADMLARIQSDVINYAPSWCIVMGGINDIHAGVPVSTTWANLKAIYSALFKAGIHVVAMTVTPSTWYDAPMAAAWSDLNYRIREYGKQTSGFVVVDASAGYIDTTSATAAPLANYTRDGTHPAPLGAQAIGKLVYNQLNTIIPPVPSLPISNVADSTNLISNPMMTGAGGTIGPATGTIATGWTVQKSAEGACVASETARSDGFGNYQVLTFSSGTTWNSFCDIAQTIPDGALVPGNKVFIQSEISSVNSSCQVSLAFMDSSWSWLGSTSGIAGDAAIGISTAAQTGMVFRSPTVTVPPGTAHVQVSIEIHGISGAISIGRVEVRQPAVL